MESGLVYNLLWLVPLVVWYCSKNTPPVLRSAIRGASFGAIVSPASLGLYSLYFLNPVAAVFGMFGLVLVSIHGGAGYEIATRLELISSYAVVAESDRKIISVINSLFWAFVYGSVFLGYRSFRLRITK